MHIWRQLIALGIFAACVGQAAVIYKWTDAQGIIHYSDQSVPGAQKILTNSTAPAPAPVPAAQPAPAPASAAPAAGVNYSVFAIVSPKPDQSYFSEPVPVQLQLDPALQPAHKLDWYLNGSRVAGHANALQFTFGELPRGAYTLLATIVDATTGESASSQSVTFYVHRPSLLMPQHHKAP